MRLFDMSLKLRVRYINYLENLIMLNIRAKMIEENRRLTGDEIEGIIHKELTKLKEQV